MVAIPQGCLSLSPGSVFGLNILQEGRTVRRHFSTQRLAPLDHLPFTLTDHGCARLSEALAHLDCTVVETLSLGDQTLIYATVAQGDLLTQGMPAMGQ